MEADYNMKIIPNIIKVPKGIATLTNSDTKNTQLQEYDTFELDYFETLDCPWRFNHYEEYRISNDIYVIEYDNPRLQKITRKIFKLNSR